MMRRRRFKQTGSFTDRLEAFAKDTREKALPLPAGRERDDLLTRRADSAAHLEDWARSRELQPPS